jgi:D-alanyl-D-alanine dipeptidase
MVAAVRTSTGKAMAAAALDADPGEWWHDMASSYGAKLADWEP